MAVRQIREGRGSVKFGFFTLLGWKVYGLAMSGRVMRYPYTMGAKVMQFPYKFHWDNCWFTRAMVLGSIICMPLWVKIQKKVNGGKMHSYTRTLSPSMQLVVYGCSLNRR